MRSQVTNQDNIHNTVDFLIISNLQKTEMIIRREFLKAGVIAVLLYYFKHFGTALKIFLFS